MNFEYGDPKAWTESAVERKSRVAGSKSGDPNYRILVTGAQYMCGVKLVNDKGVHTK